MKKLILIALSVFLPSLSLAQTPQRTTRWDLSTLHGTTSDGFNISNGNVGAHIFTWSLQSGSMTSCTLSFQTSPNNKDPWTEQTTGDCTGNGTTVYLIFVSNFVRVKATAFVVSSGTALVSVNYNGYVIPPTSIAAITTAPVTNTNINNIRYAKNFNGADECIKIANAFADLPSTGGVVYETAEGAVSCSVNPFNGISKAVRLELDGQTISTTAPWTLAAQNQEIKGIGNRATILKYTGSATSYVLGCDGSGVTNGINCRIKDLRIDGNALATNGVNWLDTGSALLDNVSVTNTIGAGFVCTSCILSNIFNLSVSSNIANYTTQPTNGILFNSGGVFSNNSANTVINFRIEGVSGSGVKLINSFNGVFLGGNSESNNQGLELAGSSSLNIYNNSFTGTDFESNTTRDIYCNKCQANNFYGINSASSESVHIATSTGNNHFSGGTYLNGPIVDSGSNNNKFDGIQTNTAITDNGQGTIIEDVLTNGVYSSNRPTLDCGKFNNTDIGSKINACINALPSTGGVADARSITGTVSWTNSVTINKANVDLLLGAATFQVTSNALGITNSRISVLGLGSGVTVFQYTGSSDITIINETCGVTTCAYNKFSGLGFTSGETAHVKTAIALSDQEENEVSDISIVGGWTKTATKDCVGIRVYGRQSLYLHRLTINADRPLQFSVDPNLAHAGVDHFHLEDLYLLPSATNSNILIDDGINIGALEIDGYEAWVGGAYGLLFSSTTDTGAVNSINVQNVRWEGCPGTPAGYGIYLSNTNGFKSVNIQNNYFGLCNGLYLKDIQGGLVSSNTMDTITTALSGHGDLRTTFVNNIWGGGALSVGTSLANSVQINNNQDGSITTKLVGVTDGSTASSGYVGQVINASVAPASAISLTTNTAANITTTTLPAGDWEISGTVGYTAGASTSVTRLVQGTAVDNNCSSSPSTTLGGAGTASAFITAAMVPGSTYDNIFSLPTYHISTSGNITLCLSTIANFTVSTLKAYGIVTARRMR